MPDLARRCLAEGVATFLLVFVGVGAIAADAAGSGTGPVGVSLAFAFVVAAMVYATGHLSGAHLNPAVTLAFRAIGRFPGREVGPYVAAQLGGASAAALLLDAAVGLGASTGTTTPTIGLGGAWLVEAAITFALMFVITAVATDPRSASGFAGAAIGLAVGMGALMGGPLTGGSMNPARSFGPALATGAWGSHWLYWTAPACGALLGAFAYQAVRGVAPEGRRPDPSEPGPASTRPREPEAA